MYQTLSTALYLYTALATHGLQSKVASANSLTLSPTIPKKISNCSQTKHNFSRQTFAQNIKHMSSTTPRLRANALRACTRGHERGERLNLGCNGARSWMLVIMAEGNWAILSHRGTSRDVMWYDRRAAGAQIEPLSIWYQPRGFRSPTPLDLTNQPLFNFWFH